MPSEAVDGFVSSTALSHQEKNHPIRQPLDGEYLDELDRSQGEVQSDRQTQKSQVNERVGEQGSHLKSPAKLTFSYNYSTTLWSPDAQRSLPLPPVVK